MQISGWELLKVCHHLGKCCEHRHYDSGGIVFLICYMISREHMFKGLCEFMGGIPSRRLTTFPFLAAIGLVQMEYKVFNMPRDLTKPRE